MTTKTKLATPEALAREIVKQLRKRGGFTIDVHTGEDAGPCNFTVGGMIRPFGNFGALYHSPTGEIDVEDLTDTLRQNWHQINVYGYVGAWSEYGQGREVFIDSVYLIPCACDTAGGYSLASLHFATSLGKSNEQIAIGHLCHTERDGFKEIKL